MSGNLLWKWMKQTKKNKLGNQITYLTIKIIVKSDKNVATCTYTHDRLD